MTTTIGKFVLLSIIVAWIPGCTCIGSNQCDFISRCVDENTREVCGRQDTLSGRSVEIEECGNNICHEGYCVRSPPEECSDFVYRSRCNSTYELFRCVDGWVKTVDCSSNSDDDSSVHVECVEGPGFRGEIDAACLVVGKHPNLFFRLSPDR